METRIEITREALVISDEEFERALQVISRATQERARALQDALARALLTPLPAWKPEPIQYTAPDISTWPEWRSVVVTPPMFGVIA